MRLQSNFLSIVISHKKKFIFIHVPKTGGNSINLALGDYCDSDFSFRRVTTKDIETYGLDVSLTNEATGHLLPSEVMKVVGPDKWKEYFKFGFVRNPFERLVSDFFYLKKKAEEGVGKEETFYFTKRIKEISDIVNFREYVLLLQKKININASRWLCNEEGNTLVDFVGRFERLQDDFDLVCKKIGLENRKLPLSNSTCHEHYSKYYDYETRRIVEALFWKDLNIFGYKFEINGSDYYKNSWQVFFEKIINPSRLIVDFFKIKPMYIFRKMNKKEVKFLISGLLAFLVAVLVELFILFIFGSMVFVFTLGIVQLVGILGLLIFYIRIQHNTDRKFKRMVDLVDFPRELGKLSRATNSLEDRVELLVRQNKDISLKYMDFLESLVQGEKDEFDKLGQRITNLNDRIMSSVEMAKAQAELNIRSLKHLESITMDSLERRGGRQ